MLYPQNWITLSCEATPDIDIYNNEDYINLAGSEPGDPDDNIELDPGDRFENFREELAIQDGFEAESWLTEFGYCGANNWQVTKLMIEEMEIGRLDYIDRYSPFLTRTDMWRTYGGYLEVSESETPNISANQCDPGRYYHPDDNRYMFSESNAHLCSSIPTMEPDDPICSYIDCSINEHPNLQDFYIAFADEIDQNEAEGRKKAERAWVHASEAFCRNYTNSFSDTYWTFYDVSNDLEMKPLGHWYKNFDPATLSNDPPSDTLPIEPDH